MHLVERDILLLLPVEHLVGDGLLLRPRAVAAVRVEHTAEDDASMLLNRPDVAVIVVHSVNDEVLLLAVLDEHLVDDGPRLLLRPAVAAQVEDVVQLLIRPVATAIKMHLVHERRLLLQASPRIGRNLGPGITNRVSLKTRASSRRPSPH
ncbi:unnamed protein product [Prorocentrum cordatum]|uniref:Secreted protein n=1 Tax=Prorocentrum cordatum TaxID=2364126 RepID=A0ABN9R062_9DINO|nr:unnamed protein product [Polarella glacialis]